MTFHHFLFRIVLTLVSINLTTVLSAAPPAGNSQVSIRKLSNPQDFETTGSFGFSVDVDGDWMAVGARDSDVRNQDAYGLVRIYRRMAPNNWEFHSELLCPDDFSEAFRFGHRVGLQDTTLLVVSYGTDSQTNSDIGRFYIFELINDEWTLQQRLTPPDLNPDDNEFDNFQVDFNGDTLIIGRPTENNGSPNYGSALIYRRSEGTWNFEAKLQVPPPDPPQDGFPVMSFFGLDVALGDDIAFVGARYEHDFGEETGIVYAFVRNNGVWSQAYHIRFDELLDQGQFGNSIEYVDGRLMVGAPNTDRLADRNTAIVYTFFVDEQGWTLEDVLTDGIPWSRFGADLAADGDFMVVGSTNWSTLADQRPQDPDWGKAYFYRWDGNRWNLVFDYENDNDGDEFAYTVNLDGSTALITAYGDGEAGPNAGAVFAFEEINGLWQGPQKIVADNTPSGDEFGAALAVEGDTLFVGAPGDVDGVPTDFDDPDPATQDAGSVMVFTRNAEDWQLTTTLLADDGTQLDGFGRTIAVDGDLVAVGALQDDNGEAMNSDYGSVYLFERTGDQWTQVEKLTAPTPESESNFGSALLVSGETVFVGVEKQQVGNFTSRGEVYVYERLGDGWQLQQTLGPEELGTGNDGFGASLAMNQGLLYVGAPFTDGFDGQLSRGNAGAVYIFEKNNNTWSRIDRLMINYPDDEERNARFGTYILVQDDWMAVGAPGGSFDFDGSVIIFRNDNGNWVLDQRIQPTDGLVRYDDNFGAQIAYANGYLAVASQRAENDDQSGGLETYENVGAVRFYRNNAGTWEFVEKVYSPDPQRDAQLGFSLASYGNEFLAGAPYTDDPQFETGVVFIFSTDGATGSTISGFLLR